MCDFPPLSGITLVVLCLQLEPLRKQLQKLKTDNTKMATSMEAMVRANQQLQGTAEALQDQLQQKAHVMQQLQQARFLYHLLCVESFNTYPSLSWYGLICV